MSSPPGLAEFEDVPALPTKDTASTPSVMLAHRAELPRTVVSLSGITMVSARPIGPGVARASLAAGELCGGPPFGDLVSRAGDSFQQAVAVAEVLADPRLGDWLRCGRAAAIASSGAFEELQIRFVSNGPWVTARFFSAPEGAAIAPPFFEAPSSVPAGLAEVRCASLDADACVGGAPAVARFPRWGVVGVGPYMALAAVAAAAPPFWRGATASVDAADIVGREFTLSAGPHPFLGFLDETSLHGIWYSQRAAVDRALVESDAVTLAVTNRDREGHAFLTLTPSAHAGVPPVDGALGALRVYVARQQASQLKLGAPPDDTLETIISRVSLRAVASGSKTIVRDSVRFDGTLTPTAEERRARDTALVQKQQRYLAWSRVLESTFAGAAPAHADLALMGGEEFALAVEAHMQHTPRAFKRAPLERLPNLEMPYYGGGPYVDDEDGPDAVTHYWPLDIDVTGDILDALRSQGFELTFNRIWRHRIGYLIQRGVEVYQVEITPGRYRVWDVWISRL